MQIVPDSRPFVIRERAKDDSSFGTSNQNRGSKMMKGKLTALEIDCTGNRLSRKGFGPDNGRKEAEGSRSKGRRTRWSIRRKVWRWQALHELGEGTVSRIERGDVQTFSWNENNGRDSFNVTLSRDSLVLYGFSMDGPSTSGTPGTQIPGSGIPFRDQVKVGCTYVYIM